MGGYKGYLLFDKQSNGEFGYFLKNRWISKEHKDEMYNI
jgi:hypothetical protein